MIYLSVFVIYLPGWDNIQRFRWKWNISNPTSHTLC